MVTKAVRRIKDRLIRSSGQSLWVAKIFVFFGKDFDREISVAFKGRSIYRRGVAGASGCGAVYLLRRNTHRLEKALIMRPRRGVFALGYIEETVQMYQYVAGLPERDDSLVRWASDVLAEYFSVVDCDGSFVLESSGELFRQVNSRLVRSDEKPVRGRAQLAPYLSSDRGDVGVAIEAMEQLAMARRSCRWFLPGRVSREVVDRAIGVALLSPSACNRQPFRYVVLDRKSDAVGLASIVAGTKGFVENLSGVIAVVGSFDAFAGFADRHVPYIDASLATMALQFAFEAQGVGTCCINWPDREGQDRNGSAYLGLKDSERILMLIAYGNPDPEGMVPFSHKKDIGQMRSYR